MPSKTRKAAAEASFPQRRKNHILFRLQADEGTLTIADAD